MTEALTPTLEQRIVSTDLDRQGSLGRLIAAVDQVGMTRKYMGDNPHPMLVNAIEEHARNCARLEMLKILSTEDFFVAMSRSAGALKQEG
jgi:hypothetical protein